LRLEVHLARFALIEEDGETDRARAAKFETLEEEILGDAGIEDGVHEEDVAAAKHGRRGEEDLAAIEAAEVDVAGFRADEVANHGSGNAADEVGAKYEGVLEDHDDIDSAASVVAGDGATQLVNAGGQAFFAVGDSH
jgi:hypothetical protein